MRLLFAITILLSIVACKNENTTPEITTVNSTTTASADVSTIEYPLVEFYRNTNGVQIYNGFVDADTSMMSSGNKYMIDVVAYELWGKFLYLDKNNEFVATDKPDELTLDDLGSFHPYLLRVSMMKKPGAFQNVQTVQVSFSDNGVSSIHRTDFLKARVEGWDMQLSTKKNFSPCIEDDLKCKAESVLSSIVASLFR
jgi:hypothetical protein